MRPSLKSKKGKKKNVNTQEKGVLVRLASWTRHGEYRHCIRGVVKEPINKGSKVQKDGLSLRK